MMHKDQTHIKRNGFSFGIISSKLQSGCYSTRAGYDSIWVVVDHLTKAAHFIPVNTTYNSVVLAELYMSLNVCLHGVPKKIVSDRGTQFTYHFWQHLHEALGTLEVQFSLSPIDRWSDWENQLDSWRYVESLRIARQVRLGQDATVCRILLQQQLSGQFEDVTVPSTLWEELQNSVALGPTRRKVGVRFRYSAWVWREHQNGSREFEDSTVQTAKLCWHPKKRIEFWSRRLCLLESVTHQRNQKVRSQRQASTLIHRTVPDSTKAWRSGISTQLARKSVSRTWCVSCVSAKEMLASTRRAVANRGPWSSGISDILWEANSDSRDSRSDHSKKHHPDVQSQMGPSLRRRSNLGKRGWFESQVP
jgi:hypothetical protein